MPWSTHRIRSSSNCITRSDIQISRYGKGRPAGRPFSFGQHGVSSARCFTSPTAPTWIPGKCGGAAQARASSAAPSCRGIGSTFPAARRGGGAALPGSFPIRHVGFGVSSIASRRHAISPPSTGRKDLNGGGNAPTVIRAAGVRSMRMVNRTGPWRSKPISPSRAALSRPPAKLISIICFGVPLIGNCRRPIPAGCSPFATK